MTTNIEGEIHALERMTTGELAERYAELHGRPCRTRHRAYLIRKNAWRIQANTEGDLSERARRIRGRAAELADDAEVRVMAPKTLICPPQHGGTAMVTRVAPTGTATPSTDPRLPPSGSAIVRKYKGRTHRVVVLEDAKGFEYEGDRSWYSITPSKTIFINHPLTAEVSLTDPDPELGNPASHIDFSIHNSSASPSVHNHKATFVWPADAVGTYTLTASIPSGAAGRYDPSSISKTIRVVDGDIALDISKDAVPKGDTVTLTVQLNDDGAGGNPIAQQTITFSVKEKNDAGEWVDASGWPSSATTNGQGFATATSPALEAKEYQVTANWNDSTDGKGVVGYEVTSITLTDSDGRSSTGESPFLSIVPPNISESITGTATFTPATVSANPRYPSWKYLGNDIGEGQDVTFKAGANAVNSVFLFGADPLRREVYAGDKSCELLIYTNHEGTLSLNTPQLKDIKEAFNSLGKIAVKIGNPIFEPEQIKLSGDLAFKNKWVEDPDSNRVKYNWSLEGECKATAGIKVKFSTALAGIPPFLVEADAYVAVRGSMHLKANAHYTGTGEFQPKGEVGGYLSVGVGGEVDIVEGLLSIGVEGTSRIAYTGTPHVTALPPKVTIDSAVRAGGLTVTWQATALWIISYGDDWKVWDPWTLWQDSSELVPGPFAT